MSATLQAFMDQLNAESDAREVAHSIGIPALLRLVPVALSGTGQGATVGRLLLGLYNGNTYPFDLNALRGLDLEIFRDCLAVLLLDRYPVREIHQYHPNGDAVFRQLQRMHAVQGGAQ